jgi:hypothetical protein
MAGYNDNNNFLNPISVFYYKDVLFSLADCYFTSSLPIVPVAPVTKIVSVIGKVALM